MKFIHKSKILLSLSFCTLISATSLCAEKCPEVSGQYGDGIQYQNMFCRIFISADKTDPKSYRNITFTEQGLLQVFSNFPGTTNSNSTGARVYYLFPIRENQKITSMDETHLSVTHSSGVQFEFSKNGTFSSKDLKMKVSKEINSQNKSGVEIESYPKGLIVDLGYRMGNTPVLNPKAVVTITDKNKKKCTFLNSEFNKIEKYEATLIYKTNESFHKFLSIKCPELDISDLLIPAKDNLKVLTNAKTLGISPVDAVHENEDNSKRSLKPQAASDDSTTAVQKSGVSER